MAVNSSTTSLFASGEIKFSDLRDTFKGSGTEIKASELFRDTNTNQPNPVVPDATENVNISSDGTDLSLLGFRNSIKEYTFTQSGTDTKVDIDALNWNSNLPKNINKKFIVNGTIGSDDTSVPAASVDAEIRNLTINIGSDGKIHGAGGAGGVYGINSGKGGDGGTALYARSTATDSETKSIIVDLIATGSQLWAGGGGGGAGPKGGTGGTGATVLGIDGGAGATGGNGGNGGNGEGYSQSKSDGVSGIAGDLTGAGGNTKEYRLNVGGVMTTKIYTTGTGGGGGNGGEGGNGGLFGSNGDNGSSTGQTQGGSGGSTSPDAIHYTIPSNSFTGMTIQYSDLHIRNLASGVSGTPYSNGVTPYPDGATGNSITGYKRLEYWDGSGGDWNAYMEIETASSNPASNPRFTTDGNGLVADSSGKIKVTVKWDDDESYDGMSVKTITINANDSNNNQSFTKSGNNTVTHEFDYDPNITNGNLVAFGVFREAGYANFITFGGKYDSALSDDIDPTGVIPTFGPGTDNKLNTVCHDIPSDKTGPIWGITLGGSQTIRGIRVSTNAGSIGLIGIELDDEPSGDDDYNDLVIIPLKQSGIELSTTSVSAPNPPASPTDSGDGGIAGRYVDGSNYTLVNSNSTNTKGSS